jgi:CRP-like cAMP-binding protein
LEIPKNYLIARLPRKDRLRLLKACKSVPLKLKEVLSEGKRPLCHVYFPTAGFISLVTPMKGKPVLEIGMVGCEGMVGALFALEGAPAEAVHTVVQGAGTAWRIDRTAFRRELARSKALRHVVHLYLQMTIAQLATGAACMRFHSLGERLARWLLMMHDRAHSDSFRVTHEFLAFMLGMRRVGITTAAGALQRRGVIKYRRGSVTVLNRRRLETAACSCYAADRKVYAKLFTGSP